MFDLVAKHVAGFSRFGFSSAHSLEKMPRNLHLATQSHDEVRMLAKKRRLFFLTTFEPDTGAIRAVAAGKSAFILPLAPLLACSGSKRASLIARMRFFAKQCMKYRAPLVLCSLAEGEDGMRSVSELAAIGELLGLSYEQSMQAMRILPEIIGTIGDEGQKADSDEDIAKDLLQGSA
jgi:hypothetical protein